MKLTCPACNAGINPTEVNLKEGIAHCSACNEYFKIADSLRDSDVIRRIQKPESSKIIVEKSASATSFWIPQSDWKIGTFFLLVFAVALMIVAGKMLADSLAGKTEAGWKLLGVTGFGLFIGYVFLRTAFESETITFGRNGLTLTRNLWGWKREKGGNTRDLEAITEEVDNSGEGSPTYEIRLTFRNRRAINFGRNLNPEERKWLVGELNALKDEYAHERLKGQ